MKPDWFPLHTAMFGTGLWSILMRRHLILTWFLAALAAASTSPGFAGVVASGAFGVTVNLTAGAPQAAASAFCTKTGAGTFGATVTVVCATGALVDLAPSHSGQPWIPTHGGAYRYVTQVSNGAGLLGTVDFYAEFGTVTAWRVISNADREYLEMTVGW